MTISVIMGVGRGAEGAFQAESAVSDWIVSQWATICDAALAEAKVELDQINTRYQPLLQMANGGGQ